MPTQRPLNMKVVYMYMERTTSKKLINPSENRINATFSLPFFTKGGWAIQTTASKNAEKTSFEFDEETYEPVLKVDEWSVNIPLYFADTEEAEIYDLQGRRLTRFQKGMNIIKQGNSVRKVFKE